MQIVISGYGEASVTPTTNPRIAIFNGGDRNWRTVAKDDLDEWAITGPPYATKGEAFIFAREVERMYFG